MYKAVFKYINATDTDVCMHACMYNYIFMQVYIANFMEMSRWHAEIHVEILHK